MCIDGLCLPGPACTGTGWPHAGADGCDPARAAQQAVLRLMAEVPWEPGVGIPASHDDDCEYARLLAAGAARVVAVAAARSPHLVMMMHRSTSTGSSGAHTAMHTCFPNAPMRAPRSPCCTLSRCFPSGCGAVEDVILRDVPRTFPEHPLFSAAEGQGRLLRLLKAYAAADPEVRVCVCARV